MALHLDRDNNRCAKLRLVCSHFWSINIWLKDCIQLCSWRKVARRLQHALDWWSWCHLANKLLKSQYKLVQIVHYVHLEIHISFIHSFIHSLPLEERNAKCRHQSLECTILRHVDCFIQGEVIGFQVLLDSLYPCSMKASWWCPPVLQGGSH